MPNPTIPNFPPQGIQAQLDLLYLYNPDVANELIEELRAGVKEVREIEERLKEALKDSIHLKGSVQTVQDLPRDAKQGDVWFVSTLASFYIRMNEDWKVLGGGEITHDDTLKGTGTSTNPLGVSDGVLGDIVELQETVAGYGDIVTHNAEEFATNEHVDAVEENLQEQIDGITASSDVKDVVGTYAQLQAYDKSKLGDNDIIKVLQDETKEDASTYYRYVAATQEFVYIGKEGPFYSKAETDGLLSGKQDTLVSGTNIKTINNESLLGEGNIDITSAEWGNIEGTLENQTDLKEALDAKQARLVSGWTIKTINNHSVLGSGNLEIESTSIIMRDL